MTTSILGISALYHDAAAAILVDGKLVAAAQEERFTRIKHDEAFPVHAIQYCLQEAGLKPDEVDYIGFYDKPFRKFDRLLETYLAFAPVGYRSFSRAIPAWLKSKQFVPRQIEKVMGKSANNNYVFLEHHESHAASAFFLSPFDEAAILTLDGVGEWSSASLGTGRGNRISLHSEMHFPHSLGLLYSAFTYYTGFEVNSGEYKMMGLAPFGEPTYYQQILERLMDLKEDGSFRLDLSYFNYCQGLTMTSQRFHQLFGAPPRAPEAPITQREMDLAASIQKVTEEVVLRTARHLHATTGMKKLCLAGGVALNCVANGRLSREGPFEQIWVQPAAGDAGGAVGAVTFIWHQLLENPRVTQIPDSQHGSLLGTQYSDDEIESFLRESGASYRHVEHDDALYDEISHELDSGKVIGWFQGRMEFGPRALGNRSILADPRKPEMQATINRKVKFREGFRPFAPIILSEYAHDYFQMEPGQESPYMLMVAPVREEIRLQTDQPQETSLNQIHQVRSIIPAATHIDYSARVQTVDQTRNPRLRALMERFHHITGSPVLLNTSFNLGWDPIVESPQDAYHTFMASELDLLCIGNCILRKEEQRAVIDAREGRILRDKLISPCCSAGLKETDGEMHCDQCGHAYPMEGEIPLLFWPHQSFDDSQDVTETVKAFYEETPFPHYDDNETVRSLIDKSRKRFYAKRLDDTLPYNGDILEAGCGTGQLSNFLGISCRRVVGTDICLNSLKLGNTFRSEQGLDRVRFAQMNLFRPIFRRESFDTVICNGVLHHTSDPYGGFQSLLTLLKPQGYIIIGLYNTYGRLLTDLRRQLFRLTRGKLKLIDPILRRSGLSEDKRKAWFADQYQHPHESKHSFDEILEWFDENDIEFIRGIPAMRLEDDGMAGHHLFEPQPRGSVLNRFFAQLAEIFAPGQKEGGFFIMIGKKKR